jgi:predicted  nucleic acid-binding Zn-ribbon protein
MKVEHYVEQQSLFAMMRGDLDKYKNVYEKTVECETMYSPFTPVAQFKPEQLASIARRNDIVDLTKVMGETKLQYAEFEKRIKEQNLEIADLKKQLAILETERNRDNTQRERQMQELQEFQRNAKFAEKSLRDEFEKADKARAELKVLLDKEIADTKLLRDSLNEETGEDKLRARITELMAVQVQKLQEQDVNKFVENPLQTIVT